MVRLRTWLPLALCLTGSFWGCNSVSPVLPPLSSPLFPATAEDSLRLARLTHELDTRALQCLEAAGCGEVHFSRALVSLFENREAAQASFKHVISDKPSSDLADSSKLWLRLIEDESTSGAASHEGQSPLRDVTARLVRDWMDKQLAEYTNASKTNAPIVIADQSQTVQTLEKQLREREQRITILRSQLDALKVIDTEKEERKRPVKVPATLLPLMDQRR